MIDDFESTHDSDHGMDHAECTCMTHELCYNYPKRLVQIAFAGAIVVIDTA